MSLCTKPRCASAQTWHCTSLHKTWQLWDCQSIFHVLLPGGWAEHRREAGSSARHPASGTREALCWGRWIFSFRQLPCCDRCHGLVLPCLLITAICCPGFNSEPVHAAMVPWHGYSQAPGGTAGMERHRASRLAPACSMMLPAMRLCKHQDGGPGLTLCHCAWVASALGRAHQTTLQPLGAEGQRVRPQCSGQAWGTAPLSSPRVFGLSDTKIPVL